MCRLQHDFGDTIPIVRKDSLVLVHERRRMHRDLWVRIIPKILATFCADGLVTKRCAFRGAGNDADVFYFPHAQ